ncbi:uncharacterized protein B0P05DRAFT_539641 [Gilbertella persicaria]|uniref:RING-type E3 ubiquitin transferase BRCA1 n=1 Tax=Rhizopus stolonifer TaxID=4846 RepID=A0A367KPQ2_RHIST|nr:uncharacterized protein B0P05DRAFT_539641 [Gilbertella persicaria]KAI8080793.1 hypothetical protein B0P05DRAFT_539641 [Gilbertella persicaria]RCI04127.1 hypothetical protein CU098_005929 [Rhizopus stolonifer]
MLNRTKQADNTIGGLLAGMTRELNCSSCFSLFNTPTITYCGHTFCSACIKNAITTNSCCPLCQEPLTLDQLSNSVRLQSIVTELSKLRDQFQREFEVDLSQVQIQYITDHDREQTMQANSLLKEKSLQKIPVQKPAYQYRVCQANRNPIHEMKIPNVVLESKISSSITHLVIDADKHGLVKANQLYRIGVMFGCYIVNENWLRICIERNEMVPEERFEIQGDTIHGRTGAANKARINRSLKKPNLFKGIQVGLIDDAENKYRRLLTVGRATIGDEFEDMIVCSDKPVNTEELRQKYPNKTLVSIDWINDCIDNYEILKKDSYIL